MTDHDPITQKALFRFQVISAYLAADPPRGKCKAFLEQLAAKQWMLESGQVVTFEAETARSWIRAYKTGGFEALKNKLRTHHGKKAIPDELIECAVKLKLEVPERTLDRIIAIMENMQLASPGIIRRSTLHRELQDRGLSKRKLKPPDHKDLDRWQADYANDLWQSDMLQGPWLPDPDRTGKMRRTYLYAFLDDASRLLLYGRFFFKGDLPALELVFKRSLQRYGKPARVYYDNGMVFRSNHMRLICAELGIHKPIHTKPYRPMGHGKIEAFNRYCVNNFIAEVKASSIITLDELNEAYLAWVEEEYNTKKHSELAISPKQRWMRDTSRIQYLDEQQIRIAFLWRQLRTADKAGIITLFNQKYKVAPELTKRKIEIRYDPERLDEIEIYLDGTFRQRAKPAQISRHRAPKQIPDIAKQPPPEQKTDYLGWLTQVHKQKTKITPQSKIQDTAKQASEFVSILKQRLAPEVFDEAVVREFFQTFGPFEHSQLTRSLDDLLASQPPNLHITFYLDHIKTHCMGELL